MGGRLKGKPMYRGKSVQGSHYFTRRVARILAAASRRTGKSVSDLLEHGARQPAVTELTRAQADAIAEAEGRD